MNEYTEKKIMAFMRILTKLGLNKDEVCGICSFLETEEMMIEMLDRLEAKDFKMTPQEAMNICAGVIKEHKGIHC